MNEPKDKVDRTNELLSELVTLQKEAMARQSKFLKLYKVVIGVGVVFFAIYLATSLFLL